MFQFKLDNGLKLDLEKSEKVFTPTGTTETIIEGIIENNNGKRSILDLGCGCGVIGLSLFKNGLVKEPLYASDLSDAAIENVKLNAEKMGCAIDAKKSNLFSAWENKKFETQDHRDCCINSKKSNFHQQHQTHQHHQNLQLM